MYNPHLPYLQNKCMAKNCHFYTLGKGRNLPNFFFSPLALLIETRYVFLVGRQLFYSKPFFQELDMKTTAQPKADKQTSVLVLHLIFHLELLITVS